jgi:hypothetical protein
LAGAVIGLAVLGTACSGIAQADNSKDPGPNRNQARQQADKPAATGPAARPDNKHADDLAAVKAQATIRDQAANLPDADAMAAAMRDFVENTAGFVAAPVPQQAVLGPGGPVPTVGMGGLVPNARALAAYIATTYPSVQAIGGVRSDPLPDHPSGHAIDIMIGSDMGLGDAINADVQGQTGRFGVVYTLWRVPNHFNHVHVTVS